MTSVYFNTATGYHSRDAAMFSLPAIEPVIYWKKIVEPDPAEDPVSLSPVYTIRIVDATSWFK